MTNRADDAVPPEEDASHVLEAHKVLIRREAEQIWNANDVDLADELFAEEFVGHFDVGPVQGRRAVKSFITELMEALPDIRMTIDDLVGEGDRVVTRWRAIGTHKSEYRGVRPTGKRVTISGITIWRLANGKIVESWSHRDLSALLPHGGGPKVQP
jgi:steroid delta-isomerase-like uncharacterized protein